MLLFSVMVEASSTEELKTYVEKMMEEADLPGVMVTVVQDGEEPIYINEGWKNEKNKEAVTKQTRFELGSNSKAFTGLGLLYLVEQRKLSLDASVSEYLPWFQLKYRGKEEDVKVKDLLYQTSGVNPSTIGILKKDDSKDALYTAVKDLTGYKTVAEPGTSFLYATMNYDCLGLLIEAVTGESYEKFMNETIFQRYGLTNTYAGKKKTGEDKLQASGYKLGLFGNVEYQAPVYRGNTPAGYIITDGEDLGKWLKIQLDAAMKKETSDQLVVKSQIPDTRVKPVVVQPYSNGFQYGAGWLVFEDGIISHGGDNPDFSSYFLINGEEGYAVGVLCNRDSSYAYGIAKGISDMLMGKEPAKAPADIFMEIITVLRVGIPVISGLLVWAVVIFIRRCLVIRKNHYSLVQLFLQNRKKLIIRLLVMLLILGIPSGLIAASMYSLDFLSVWAPQCVMAFLAETVVLFVLASVNRMIHVILPKGGTL